jgi:hypothetical protein
MKQGSGEHLEYACQNWSHHFLSVLMRGGKIDYVESLFGYQNGSYCEEDGKSGIEGLDVQVGKVVIFCAKNLKMLSQGWQVFLPKV